MTDQPSGEAGRLKSLIWDFEPPRLIGTVLTGLVLAMVNALLSIALMSLIFQGEIDHLLPQGLGLGLVASAVIAVVIALGSGVPGSYAGVQDASAAILGLAAGSIATAVAAPRTLATVVALMMATSLATGVVLVLMGRFRLGEIARFVPFPVIGGLLAGTGYLILVGSIEILGGLTGQSLVGSNGIALLWPGVALALLFFVASRLGWTSRVYLGILVAAIAGFHAISRLLGVGNETATSRGWLLGPFPDGSLWPGVALRHLAEADWGLVAGEAASIATVLLIVPLTVLLYVSALEVETRRDLDVALELRVTGWANVAAGLVGGPPGYLYLADTLVTRRVIGERRGPAVIAALGVGLVVLAGGGVLGLLPQFVVGGMLLFVGIEFLVEWLWDARERMGRLDYLLMVSIVAIIATVGFLPGVAAGLIAAIVLFVIRYSQIDVVKHSLTAREHRSNIERAAAEAKYLDEVGGSVLILELQGFIFFGTAHKIMSEVRTQLDVGQAVRFVVCDFRLVTGIDSSALVIFERLALVAQEHGFVVVLTGLGDEQRTQFSDLATRSSKTVHFEPDLDYGVAWCEERLIEEVGGVSDGRRAMPEGLIERLSPYLDSREVPRGTALMHQGEPPPGLYLIVSGKATVQLEAADGSQVRLRTLLEGTLLGEISLYRDEPVTATVVTETSCRLLHLSPEAFTGLCEEDPGLAADLHAFVARTLAARVSHANRTIRALHR